MNNWQEFIKSEMEKDYFKELNSFLLKESKEYNVFPPKNLIFNAFDSCPLDKIKVVLLGQDCYHGKGQAHGLAFSVPKGVIIPPSLKNIYKELNSDLGIELPNHGFLESWLSQGVFLLNSALSVREKTPGSHLSYWTPFTDNAIKLINEQDRPIVYMLWGNFAREKKKLITNPKHLFLEAPHPSPFSCHTGFFGCKHFSKANNFLVQNNIEPIDWSIK